MSGPCSLLLRLAIDMHIFHTWDHHALFKIPSNNNNNKQIMMAILFFEKLNVTPFERWNHEINGSRK